jgi:hypothetical protein
VRYCELRYDDGQPGFRRGHLDELDFGLELDVEPAATFHLTWDEQAGVAGLSLAPGPLGEGLLDAAAWDVTAGGGWAALIGDQIAAVDYCWVSDPATGLSYPRAAALTFASGQRVYAVAAQYDQDSDRLISPYDGVVVFFGDDLAQRYGVGFGVSG